MGTTMSEGKTHHRHDHAEAAPSEEKDPVCGMSVRPESAAGSVEHGGSTYWFCSPGCLKKFNAAPGAYVGHVATVAKPPVRPAAAEYTCPMHPEVVRSEPGSCPICGMALEPRVVTADEAENPELRDMTRRLAISAVLAAPLFLAQSRGSLHGRHCTLVSSH